MKLFVTLATFVGLASAACPNSCSGHGTCDQYDACTCFKETPNTEGFHGTIMVEWTGADCSRRTCPRGVSWSKTSLDADVPNGPTTNVQTVQWKVFTATEQLLQLAGPIDLTFSWDEKLGYDVYSFTNAADWAACKFTGGAGSVTPDIGKPAKATDPYNSATIQLTSAGSYYFADKDDCDKGVKLRVDQVDAATASIVWKANAVGVAVEGQPAVVTFTWATGTHTVHLMENEAKYTACNFVGATQLGTATGTTFTSSTAGTYYFASNTGTDCATKIKTTVTVVHAFAPAVAVPDENIQCNHQTERECSDQGLCDRATGLCSCFAGYTGSSCQRTACPDDCSGHGTCRSNRDFAYDWAIAKTIQMHDTGKKDHTELFKEIYFASYDNAWDSDKHYGCKCDKGYRGPSCAMVECPSDKDPLDDKCKMDSAVASEITDFQLQYDAPFGAKGWEEAYSLDTGKAADGSEQATLENSDFNHHYILDNNGRKVYGCYGSMSGQDCSGRGICDYSTGTCKCFSGYAGTACEKVEEMS